MAKIVFFSIPAHGHTNPTLGIVRELIARGHEVIYYCYESMREKIEETGARFVACDEYDPQTKLTPQDGERIGKDLVFSTKLLVDMTLALDDAVLADMKALQPDLIVADSMAYWGKLIAQKTGVPFLSSTTTFAFNEHSSKILNNGSIRDLFTMLLSIPRTGRIIRRLQDKGYPVKNVLSIISNDNDTDTIVYTAAQFQPCSETFSDRYTFIGPCIRPAKEVLEKGDKPVVYISLGTVVNLREQFYQTCMEAFADGRYRVILSVGEYVDLEAFRDVPPNVSVFPKVDQMAVLKITDVFLTHCGMNSVNEALYFGVPMVLFPQTAEQGGVARQTARMGAGLLLEKDSKESLRCAVDAVFQTPSYQENASKLSDAFHRCGGVNQAVEKIEALMRAGRRIPPQA